MTLFLIDIQKGMGKSNRKVAGASEMCVLTLERGNDAYAKLCQF